MDINLSHIWPEWEIVALISKGAYGRVYKAVRKQDGDVAAIKIISIPQDEDETEKRRWDQSDETIKVLYQERAKDVLNEIDIMKKLRGSNNVVDILDYKLIEKASGIGFDICIRMELLKPMAKHLSELEIDPRLSAPFSIEDEAIKIGCDICRALEACHGVTTETKKQIIHRDIKPDNILYHSNGAIYKLGDFGISKELSKYTGDHTRSIGTLNYLAPEVMRGNYDCRADIYSLGLVLYYLTNNKKLPFVNGLGQAEKAVARRLSGEQIPPPEFASKGLAQVICKACAYRPEDRFSSAKEFRLALEMIEKTPINAETAKAVECPKATEPISTVGTFGPKKSKRKVGMVAFLCVVILGVGLFWGVRMLLIGQEGKLEDEFRPAINQTEGQNDSAGTSESVSTTTEQNQSEVTPDSPTDNRAEVGAIQDAGTSRESALSLQLDTENIKSLAVAGESDWFSITTGNTDTIYRFYVNSKINENPVNGNTTLALYDVNGIKQEQITTAYGKSGYFDVFLVPNTTYTVKVSAENTVPATGDYLLCVSQKTCDAGIDQQSAQELRIGDKYTAKLDSSLTDWYVCKFDETGRYVIELHNIDTGCRVDISGTRGDASLFSGTAKNEDSASRVINVEAGDRIYFEVKPWGAADAEIANGTYLISITKEVS